MHAPWDEDESSSGCPRGPRLQSTLIIELRALEREPLDRTLEISLSVISHAYVSPSLRSDALFFLQRNVTCLKKNIHPVLILPYSFCDNLKEANESSRLVFEKFLLGKFPSI